MLSEEQLREIEERAGKATRGPWANLTEEECSCVIARDMPELDSRRFGVALIPHCENWQLIDWQTKANNGEFIAHARTDIPALLREVRGQKARAEAAEAFVETQRKAKRETQEELSQKTDDIREARARLAALEARLAAADRLADAADKLQWTPTGAVAGLVPLEVALTAYRATKEPTE